MHSEIEELVQAEQDRRYDEPDAQEEVSLQHGVAAVRLLR
jgi:hypothetical protein